MVGLTAGETQAARLQAHTQVLREGFAARGISAEAIRVLGVSGERPRRADLLAALQPAASATVSDETWIVLLGTASVRGGEPSFQVAGPRLTATDLAEAVKVLPGRKFVVIGTTASGGFLAPLLASPDVEAVAATADSGEVNEPRFAEAWAEALVAAPRASFAELAAAAAGRVASFYESRSLAQGEHARMIERASGKIIEAPFAPDAAPAVTSANRVAGSTPGISAAEIEIPKPSTDTETERRPATTETRALIAEARAAAKDGAHAAIFLRRDTEVIVSRDFAVLERHRTRAYVRTGEALDDLGTLLLPSNPPDLLTRLEGARVITPDGSQVLVNPSSLDKRNAADQREADAARAQGRPTGPAAPPFLPLPEVTAGCIVEAAWTVERRSSGTLPEFSEEWSVSETYPVLAGKIGVTTPTDARWRVFAPNLPAAGVVENAEARTRTSTWTLTNVPAFAPRLGDAAPRRVAAWVGVSSLASWEAFASWYQRLTAGSATSGPAVAALAEEIARAHPDRAGRLRLAYERVSALRYVAIKLGVGAFRPRTPEQVWTQRYGDCKDKANLLVAVLGQLGIPAEFALVNRFDHTFTDWPAWQFNHALVRVPAAPADGQPHDLWLDSTDRLVPFGVVAPGNLGRHAFAFNAQGVGAFHEITAAQEAKSEWREQFYFAAERSTWTLRVTATGSADVTLRRLFAGLSSGVIAERIQAMLGWRAGPVKRVAAADPYDLATPFEVTVELVGTAESLASERPRLLIPGLELFRARLATFSDELWWDDGRTWTVYRGQDDTATGGEIPGRVSKNFMPLLLP